MKQLQSKIGVSTKCCAYKSVSNMNMALSYVKLDESSSRYVLMVVVLDRTVLSIIFVRRVSVDVGYVMTVIKRVAIMDIINGLKKRIIPEQ